MATAFGWGISIAYFKNKFRIHKFINTFAFICVRLTFTKKKYKKPR